MHNSRRMMQQVAFILIVQHMLIICLSSHMWKTVDAMDGNAFKLLKSAHPANMISMLQALHQRGQQLASPIISSDNPTEKKFPRAPSPLPAYRATGTSQEQPAPPGMVMVPAAFVKATNAVSHALKELIRDPATRRLTLARLADAYIPGSGIRMVLRENGPSSGASQSSTLGIPAAGVGSSSAFRHLPSAGLQLDQKAASGAGCGCGDNPADNGADTLSANGTPSQKQLNDMEAAMMAPYSLALAEQVDPTDPSLRTKAQEERGRSLQLLDQAINMVKQPAAVFSPYHLFEAQKLYKDFRRSYHNYMNLLLFMGTPYK